MPERFLSVRIPLAIYRSGKDLAAGNVVQMSRLGWHYRHWHLHTSEELVE